MKELKNEFSHFISPHLLEEFREIVDVGRVTELCFVPPLVELVLGHVRGTHLETVQWTTTRTERLEYILQIRKNEQARRVICVQRCNRKGLEFDGFGWTRKKMC